MTTDKVKEHLDHLSPETKQQAQERLNELCDRYGLERITLTHGKSRWRELCFRMIGIPPLAAKPAGRKKVISDEEKDDWFCYASIINEFVDNEDDESFEKLRVRKMAETYARKKQFDNDKDKEQYIDRLIDFWQKHGRTRYERIQQENLEAMQENDWPGWD